MALGLSKNSSKTRQETSGSETYTPNAGFTSGVQGLLNNASGMTYSPTTQGQIDSFANPYLDQVGQNTSRQLMRSRDITGNTLDGQAAAAGAFGGSGWGLLRGENNRAYADAESNALANINANGYQSALTAAQGENQSANQFSLSSLLAQLQGYGLLNYGTTTTNGLTKGKGTSIGITGSYGK